MSDSTDRALGRIVYPPQYFATDGLSRYFDIASPEEARSSVEDSLSDREGFVKAEVKDDEKMGPFVLVTTKRGFSEFNAPIIQDGIRVVYRRDNE